MTAAPAAPVTSVAERPVPTEEQRHERHELLAGLTRLRPGITQADVDASLAVHAPDILMLNQWALYQAAARKQPPAWDKHCVFEVTVRVADADLIYVCHHSPPRTTEIPYALFEFYGPESDLTSTGYLSDFRQPDRSAHQDPQAYAESLCAAKLESRKREA